MYLQLTRKNRSLKVRDPRRTAAYPISHVESEMCSFLVGLCTATLLLHGVSCHLFPQAVLEKLTNRGTSKLHKSQLDLETVYQCTLDKFDHAYQGNDSHFVTECNQSTINAGFLTLCVPKCGDVLLDAYEDCGLFNSPDERKYLAALCGSNGNGDFCYELFLDSMVFLSAAVPCFPGTCNCNSLSEGVGRQGCCIDALNDLVNTMADDLRGFSLDRVYSECNIAPVAGCDNSPLSGSTSLHHAFYTAAVAMLSALLVTTVLGCME